MMTSGAKNPTFLIDQDQTMIAMRDNPMMIRPFRPRDSQTGTVGFTLLEMTIVLIVVGLVIGMVAPLIGQITDSTREKSTSVRLDGIEEAIVAFVRSEGRVPCPADPSATPLGEERNSCNSTGTDDGIVPFRSLGLSEEAVLDGYGQFISYHVDDTYADNSLSAPLVAGGFCGVADNNITVDDEDGDDLSPTQEVVYVLVSHGENGFGRFNPSSSNRISDTSGGDFEDENADDDDNFVATKFLHEDVTDGPYDDQIAWSTKNNIANAVQEFGCSSD